MSPYSFTETLLSNASFRFGNEQHGLWVLYYASVLFNSTLNFFTPICSDKRSVTFLLPPVSVQESWKIFTFLIAGCCPHSFSWSRTDVPILLYNNQLMNHSHIPVLYPNPEKQTPSIYTIRGTVPFPWVVQFCLSYSRNLIRRIRSIFCLITLMLTWRQNSL